MTIRGSLYTPPNYHKSLRVQLAAAYSGASLEVHDYCPGNALPGPVNKCPTDVAPLFRAEDGTVLFEANAIAYFVGNTQLRGDKEEAFVTQWNNFTDQVLLPSVASWYYPLLGATAYNKGHVIKAQENVKKVLTNLNDFLESRTYFVGENVTQADLTIFTVLKLAFENLLEAGCREHYPHVLRWYTTIANQPEVKKVVGEMHLCEKTIVFDPKDAPNANADTQKGGKNREKKQQQKQQQRNQEPIEVAKPEKKEEERPKEKVKTTKDILSALPTSSFVFDDFKRVFSNEPAEKAMEYLEKHYDPNCDSIWTCEYKYPDDLNLIFMTTNLVRGMMQRLDAMRKWAFGIMNVVGVDKNNTIEGLWIWRGTGLIFELSDDLSADYDCYNWKKIELDSPEAKAFIADYFARPDTIRGMTVADSLAYK
nr:eukaryotic translation elongation factor 1 [Hymenolepis microstoma]